MPAPRLALAVIGDEIGPTLAEMISFCAEHDVRRLDMRTVGGRNLLGMALPEVAGIRRALDSAGIEVPTFVSPVLKWPAPGKAPTGSKVDFAFDPSSCPAPDPIAHAFDIAATLGAGKLRVFSHLRYGDYQPTDLREPVDRLVTLAERYGVTAEMENESVCNIGSITELVQFFRVLDPPSSRLRPLVDIGNGWSQGQPPTDDQIGFLAPRVDLIHLKDRNLAARRAVPLGDGEIPWPAELQRLMSKVTSPEVVASLEIHCFDDGRNAAARSVAALRRIAREIGVELV
jgi:sugar phosphate isomerase/epimerase